MPRSDEKDRARKYGRRARLASVRRSRHDTDALALEFLEQLRKLGVSATRIAELRRGLSATDDKRHGNAVWAILDALEDAEAGR